MGLFEDFKDAVGTIGSNILDPGGIGRKIVSETSKTAAGLFNDATAPFLAPIENIMNTFAPRIRFDIGDINARLAVTTRSEFVFPQLPRLPGAGGAGDVTGGLLADLAFDSEALRRSETDLAFLSSALRRGVYPHRSDAFFLGVSAVPKLASAGTFNGQVWVRAHATNVADGGTEADLAVGLRDIEINERSEILKARAGIAPGGPVPTADFGAALERSSTVQLRTQRGNRRIVQIDVTLQDVGGAAQNFASFVRELYVWIERRNEGYTDVLHSFVWREPNGTNLKVLFPIDRVEYISDNGDNRMQAVGRDGGGLASAAEAIDQALAAMQKDSLLDLNGKGIDRLQEILARRVSRAETVREHLWTARRKIAGLQAPENVFDFRLRYKLRLENTVNARRTITRLRMRSTGVPNADFDLGRFEMPPHSRFDMTVYPLRQDANTTNEASLELQDQRSNFTMSLVAGLGLAENVVRSVFPTGPAVDTAKLEWTVSDTAA